MRMTRRAIALLCDAYNTTPDELRNVLMQGQVLRRTSDTHEERYTHFRHMPADSKYQAVTVFSRKEDGVWWHSAAYCLKGDMFSREYGRKVARRKYFMGGHWVYSRGMRDKFDYADLAASVGAIVPEQQPDQLAA